MIIESKGTRLVSISNDAIEKLKKIHSVTQLSVILSSIGVSEPTYIKAVNYAPIQRRCAVRILEWLTQQKV